MCARKTHTEHLDVSLVRRLLVAQFPEWADLSITPVEFDGWDNTTFRLGEYMAVRLPSHAAYEPQVEKEHEWLPRLAPFLPLPVPVPLAIGVPSADFPLQWSVRRWIEGEIPVVAHIDDQIEFAKALADFLVALYRIDPHDGPPAGPHSFWRGGPLSIYDSQTREAIEVLHDMIDVIACTKVWEAALAATWSGTPVWVHGDVAATNLLVRDGRLSGVIDFGCSAIGDPACDLVISWTSGGHTAGQPFLSAESRDVFRSELGLDRATWARGRGWALWKALIVLAGARDTDYEVAASAVRVIDEVLTDHT